MTNPYTEPFGDKPPLVERQCWPDVMELCSDTDPLALRGALIKWLAEESHVALRGALITWLADESHDEMEIRLAGDWSVAWWIDEGDEIVRAMCWGPTLDDALNAACHAALDARERGRE